MLFMEQAQILNVLFSVAEKLDWAFKLYDGDGNGEIDQEEMEEIFTKLCELVNVEKDNDESAKDKDSLSGADLLVAAKLKQQQETSKLQFISQKLHSRKKFQAMKMRRKSKVRKTKSVNNLIN